MVLTNENYFSARADMEYMSASQYKHFLSCEEGAMAEITGQYPHSMTASMLIGSYVDAHFSGEMALFRGQHPEIFKRDGTLKAEFVRAEEIIARLEDDGLYMALMSGENQVIRTGTIAGVPFKIKMDSLLDAEQAAAIAEEWPETAYAMEDSGGAIVDQKIMRDMERKYVPGEGYMNFVRAWGYDIQGAIYQAVEGHELPFILAVGTKEDVPDLEAIHIPDTELKSALYQVEDNVGRFQAIKEGKIKPKRCGKCPWCRSTKKLTRFLSWDELAV